MRYREQLGTRYHQAQTQTAQAQLAQLLFLLLDYMGHINTPSIAAYQTLISVVSSLVGEIEERACEDEAVNYGQRRTDGRTNCQTGRVAS